MRPLNLFIHHSAAFPHTAVTYQRRLSVTKHQIERENKNLINSKFRSASPTSSVSSVGSEDTMPRKSFFVRRSEAITHEEEDRAQQRRQRCIAFRRPIPSWVPQAPPATLEETPSVISLKTMLWLAYAVPKFKARSKRVTPDPGTSTTSSLQLSTPLVQEPPREFSMRHISPRPIFEALVEGDVQLVSLKWLLGYVKKPRLSKNPRPLPRRQALPKAACLSPQRIKEIHHNCSGLDKLASAAQVQACVLPVIAISHAWLTETHPDPFGDNLVVIAEAIEAGFWAHKMDQVFEDCGVFLDWCSLYQEHGGKAGRTPAEHASFKRALNRTMDLWYAHQMTSVLFVTTVPSSYAKKAEVKPYGDRGWPTFERRSAQLIKRIKSCGTSGWFMCVDVAAVRQLGEEGADGSTPALVRGVSQSVASSRQVPFAPRAFKDLLEHKEFTNGADKEVVARLYAKTAAAVLSSVTELVWDHIGVSHGEGTQLGETLGFCDQLERLSMRVMGLTDAEVVNLCGALEAGALPRLKELALHDNLFGDEAASALASLIYRGAMPQLTVLALSRNRGISAVGRATVKAAASSRPGLKILLTENARASQRESFAMTQSRQTSRERIEPNRNSRTSRVSVRTSTTTKSSH